MQPKELRAIFQQTIQHALSAGLIASALSCATEKTPKQPLNPTPTSDSMPVQDDSMPAATIPATTPVASAPVAEPIEKPEPKNRGGGWSHDLPSPSPGFEKYTCNSGEAKTLTAVTPKKAPDYMLLADYGDAIGEACKTAKNATKCNAALEKAKTKKGNYLITTQGDTVTLIDKKSAKKFFGGVDSVQEAALLVYLNGIDICNEAVNVKTDTSSAYGFEVKARSCTMDMSYELEISKAGDYKIISMEEGHPCRGRRPEGLCEPEKILAQSAGEFFAEAAWQEAVSVPAFMSLARDLTRLNAPTQLINGALASAEDEVRHAKQMTQLAARFGEVVSVPEVKETAPKDLLSLAIENEREGCIHETFAALLAWYQAETAQDQEIRAELSQIAADETKHSQLAFEIRRWVVPMLTSEQRAQLEETRQRTIKNLSQKLETLPEEVATLVGWPSLSQSKMLLSQLQQNLWS